MDTLIMVSIMTLVLFVSSGSARAATLIVSNQMQRRANVSVFVTCHGTIPRTSTSIPLGQVSLVKIPPTSGQNATDDISPTAGENDKPARSRVSQWASCVGTFGGEAQFWPSERIYRLYNSDKDSTVNIVVAKDDGFYRWDNVKNSLYKCPMIIFI
ncbi:hypothetical protein Bca52824_004681 [Brassica carinata]|uniref:Uncharacterized protein n=1 Tax=Brassica carinata TaxID=52824 RepID=A0A8X7WPX9_BRACI|nr:hypothetical protein Bca52824_004681 [Brassica carinata]